MMRNYSGGGTFNAGPVTITPSFQICGRQEEARSEMGEKAQQRGAEMKGYFFRRRRPTVLESFRFNKDVGCFQIVFSLALFFSFLFPIKKENREPHINGEWQTFNSQSD